MFRNWKFLSGIFLLFFVTVNVYGQKTDRDQIDKLFNLVRNKYSGDSAFNTVAYVEKFWRIAGNEGFDNSIRWVEQILKSAGYIEGTEDSDNPLTYRIERRPMKRLTWRPVDAEVKISGIDEPLLTYEANRSMIAVNSWATDGVIKGEVVYIPEPFDENIEKVSVKGKIVFTDARLRAVHGQALKKGAIGVFVYNMPDYLNPGKNINSIQFRSIRQDQKSKPWAIILSNRARSILLKHIEEKGRVSVSVMIDTRLYESEELTLVAEARGQKYPEKRFVLSAHVQEPGANDNASGVGAQAEMARVLGGFIRSNEFIPDRTITFLFGDEIISTRRFISDDKERAKNIMWGMSLDMVGEDTEKTGGTFLIEKMPDPAAVWLRGDDKHTEWGGRVMDPKDIVPHYFNDLALNIFERQGIHANWEVRSNPFEGGSDHVPFLRADIPGLLLWHFTDQYYHTDGDRIDKVSSKTLENVGTGALVTTMFLANSNTDAAMQTLDITFQAASNRLEKEFSNSEKILIAGGDLQHEIDVLTMWINYYKNVFDTIGEMAIEGQSVDEQINNNKIKVEVKGQEMINKLTP